ncbi:MAG TPA: type II secretion system protein N [Sideroxyarcus sp.]|nr:type II secretion system protein N [Sideroxyarcus sp.]
MQRSGGIAEAVFSWKMLGGVLLAVLLAKWVWVFFAPAAPSVPATTGWKKTEDAGRLFGAAGSSGVPAAQAVSALGDIRLIGVFAHKTKGFAVMQVDNKQLGVALGEQVVPGVRLLETHADHVIVESAGKQQRVNLVAAPVANTATAGNAVTTPAESVANPTQNVPNNAAAAPTATMPVGKSFDIEAAQAAMAKLPPDQREGLRRQLGMIRNGH